MKRILRILLIASLLMVSCVGVFAEDRADCAETILSEGECVVQDPSATVIAESDSIPWPGPDIE